MDGEKLIGKTVRMAEVYKQEDECCHHVEEFGNCVGIVEGLVDYGSFKGPEVDVRWQPAGLRYAYHPNHLEVVDENKKRMLG